MVTGLSLVLVTGNDIRSSEDLFFNVTSAGVNSSLLTSLFNSTIILVVSNVAFVLIATGILLVCPGFILTVFIVLADHDDLSAAFTYLYARTHEDGNFIPTLGARCNRITFIPCRFL